MKPDVSTGSESRLCLLAISLALVGFFADIEFAKWHGIAVMQKDSPSTATPCLPTSLALWALAMGLWGTGAAIWAQVDWYRRNRMRDSDPAMSAVPAAAVSSKRWDRVHGLLLINSLALICLFLQVDNERRLALKGCYGSPYMFEFFSPRPVALICLVLGVLGALLGVCRLRRRVP